jgi:hypothetical protein
MDWNTIGTVAAAIAAGVSAVAAVLTVQWQRRNSRLALTVNLVQQLTLTFHGQDMLNHRRDAAKVIHNALIGDNYLPLAQGNADVTTVLNFFDRVGTLLRIGALEERFLWAEFFWYVVMYEQGAQPLVQEPRLSIYLTDFFFLYERIVAFDKEQQERHGLNPKTPDKSELINLLYEESNLEVSMTRRSASVTDPKR